jgi:hypothetical protein
MSRVAPLLDDQALTLEAIPARGWRGVLLGELRKMPVTDTWQITDDVATIASHLDAGSNVGNVAGEASGVAIVDDDKPDLFRAMDAPNGAARARGVAPAAVGVINLCVQVVQDTIEAGRCLVGRSDWGAGRVSEAAYRTLIYPPWVYAPQELAR